MVLVVVYVEDTAGTPLAGDLDGGDVGAVDGEGSPTVGGDVSVNKDHGSCTKRVVNVIERIYGNPLGGDTRVFFVVEVRFLNHDEVIVVGVDPVDEEVCLA